MINEVKLVFHLPRVISLQVYRYLLIFTGGSNITTNIQIAKYSFY